MIFNLIKDFKRIFKKVFKKVSVECFGRILEYPKKVFFGYFFGYFFKTCLIQA